MILRIARAIAGDFDILVALIVACLLIAVFICEVSGLSYTAPDYTSDVVSVDYTEDVLDVTGEIVGAHWCYGVQLSEDRTFETGIVAPVYCCEERGH